MQPVAADVRNPQRARDGGEGKRKGRHASGPVHQSQRTARVLSRPLQYPVDAITCLSLSSASELHINNSINKELYKLDGRQIYQCPKGRRQYL